MVIGRGIVYWGGTRIGMDIISVLRMTIKSIKLFLILLCFSVILETKKKAHYKKKIA